jgi:hypothetical protein
MHKNAIPYYLLAALAVAPFAFAQAPAVRVLGADIPENLGGELRTLVEMQRTLPANSPELNLRGQRVAADLATGERKLVPAAKRGMLVDKQNRVLVSIHLDGNASIEELRKAFTQLGISTIAENLEYRNGSVSAYLPVRSAVALAKTPGVLSARIVHRPYKNVGATTTQGAALIHSDAVNASGITGQGITIGLLSDSFNGNSFSPTAYDDVNTGDLPNTGVPDGRPGLKFLSDGGDDIDGFTDEGRAMAQIAYDVAPGANLCFATAVLGPASFAGNIRRLRRDSGCFADVMVDDITFADAPWFSDGEIAQAINDVVTSTTLAGKQVAYFSSAGNNGGAGYAATLNFVANATARSTSGLPVNLATIPSSIDTTGGFHNFNPTAGAAPAIAQAITFNNVDPVNGLEIIMQWDDPFDLSPVGITTQLNLLVFDSTGNFVTAFNDNSFSIDEALQDNFITASGSYYFVIARTGPGSHLATQVRYLAFTGNNASTLSGDYISLNQPTILEHNGAQNAISVGAYLYDNQLFANQYTPELENYYSAGPVIQAFDSSGNRLATPLILQKPDVSAPDCVNNTFLSSYGDPTTDPAFPYATFCGTSAAAPHAAGVAALLLQAAGGPGSLTPDAIRRKLQASPSSRDIDPFFSQANLAGGGATVNITATGDGYDGSEDNPNFFSVNFTSTTAGQMLTGLTINLAPAPAGLSFNPSARSGFPFTVGKSTPGVTFGIEPDLTLYKVVADSADLLAGATVTATLSNGTNLTGTFVNKIGTGYIVNDGFGLVNALTASKAQ